MAQAQPCSPTCPSFKCSQNAALYRRDGVMCRQTEETCTVSKCQYSLCVKRRLLPNGICGETVRRKTVEHDFNDDFAEPVRLKGKALRKFGDREIY